MKRTHSGAPSGKGAVYEWAGQECRQRPPDYCRFCAPVQSHAGPRYAHPAGGP
jgi:hypothetical protein